MSDPLVSIIIPCKNYSNFVEEAICSALNQTYKNIEIVAVDDGSTDNSLEVMGKYPIKVIEHPYNMGLPFARNTAIKESSGELIIPLDADDQLHQDYAKLCVEGYQQFKDSRIGIIRTGLIHFSSEGMLQKCSPLSLNNIRDQLISNRIFVSAMFPRVIWEEVGGYSEDMNDGFEDWEFWIKIMEHNYNILTVDRCILIYRLHDRSKGRTRPLERTLISRRRMFYKHRDTWRKVFVESLPTWKEVSV